MITDKQRVMSERDEELSTGERVGACRARLRDIIARNDCEAAAGVTREERETLSAGEQRELRDLAREERS